MRKLVRYVISTTCAASMMFCMGITASAKTVVTTTVTNTTYKQVEQSLQNHGGATAVAMSSSSSSGAQWYQDTGISIPAGRTPNYNQYRLLEVAQVGDIIYEANGGYGLTGHIAIIEGKFYDEQSGQWYLRVVEATPPSVMRSIIDDSRVDDAEARLYRVTNATEQMKQNAVNFCIGELGSSYNCDLAHDTSSAESDWYCSELVWAAYKSQGLDIETTGWLNEPGVTPRDLSRSSKLTRIYF